MARSDPPPADHNEAQLRDEVKERTNNIIALEKKRSSINADINAERKKIKALNIDMDAWKASKRRAEMDPDVRAEFDRSQAVCNAALGVPIQADLFNDDAPAGEIPDAA